MKKHTSTILEYKNYLGTVEFSKTDNVYHGRLIGIDGMITYEGVDFEALKEDFKDVIDDYLLMCEEEGMQPEETVVESLAV